MRYFEEVEVGNSVRCIQSCVDESITSDKIYNVIDVLKCNSDYNIWVTIIDNRGFMNDYHISLFEDATIYRSEIIDEILR